jgi:hypothetical protein
MAVALLVHVPPDGVALSAPVLPMHIETVPVITGVAVIVIVLDA